MDFGNEQTLTKTSLQMGDRNDQATVENSIARRGDFGFLRG